MATGKILNLGGIDNRPPKANQSLGRFRVARNVYPTPDGRLIPRYDNSEIDSSPDKISSYNCLTNYNNSLLSISNSTYGEIINAYIDGVKIPKNFTYDDLGNPRNYFSQSTLTYRRNNTTYIVSPDVYAYVKYDGVELSRMGEAVAKLNTTSSSTTGTLKYVKIIAHSIDFDSSEIWSGASTIGMLTTTASIALQAGGSLSSYNLTTPAQLDTSNCGYPSNFFIGLASYSAVNNEFTVSVSSTNNTSIWSSSQIGSYVIVKFKKFNAYNFTTNYLDIDSLGMALRIKKEYTQNTPPATGGTIKLDATECYIYNSNREWVKRELYNNLTTLASEIKWGTRNFASIWASPSEFGIYYYEGFIPVFPEFASSITSPSYSEYSIAIPTTPTAANGPTSTEAQSNIIAMSKVLNDDYSITTTNISPNAFYNFGGNWFKSFYCMAVYQDLLLMANDDLIWFSSNSSATSSFEQFSALNFLKVGDTEYGRITSICATSDFLIVSRERKNYYVNGNIATGNYRVQEIEEIEIGAWSNSSMLLIKDSVIMLTALGIYSISDGGRCVKLTEKCPKNFSTYDSMNINEDVSFRLEGTIAWPKFLEDVEDYSGISMTYDEYRDLLIIMKRKEGNPCFVLHVASGEFYEWDGLLNIENYFVNSMVCIGSEYYLGTTYKNLNFNTQTPNDWNAKIYKENKTSNLGYVGNYPIKLYTSWLTAGEPSLEKLLLQLKMFGRIQSNGTSKSINIVHFKDWDYSNKITNSPYFSNNPSLDLNDQVQYSHKKRLNSDKVLAASVGFEVEDTGVTFELESIEVEFNTIQEGMKK